MVGTVEEEEGGGGDDDDVQEGVVDVSKQLEPLALHLAYLAVPILAWVHDEVWQYAFYSKVVVVVEEDEGGELTLICDSEQY